MLTLQQSDQLRGGAATDLISRGLHPRLRPFLEFHCKTEPQSRDAFRDYVHLCSVPVRTTTKTKTKELTALDSA